MPEHILTALLKRFQLKLFVYHIHRTFFLLSPRFGCKGCVASEGWMTQRKQKGLKELLT